MKITLPDGFELPENAQPGEPFEVVATLELEEDGSFQLVAIDGVELPDSEKEDDEPDEDPVSRRNAEVVMPWPEA